MVEPAGPSPLDYRVGAGRSRFRWELIVGPDGRDRSPVSIGFEWASRVITISLEFSLPALGGWWADLRLGTGPWGLVIGGAIGFAIGTYQLVRIGSGPTDPPRDEVPRQS